MNSIKNNENLVINILDLIPNEWNIKHLSNDYIKVSYKIIGRGNDPKYFIFPKNIIVDSNLIEGISMYLGDGKLSKDLSHLEFTSIDKDMLDFMFNFFKNKFNIKNKDFMFRKNAFQISGKIFRILFEKIIEEIYNSNFYLDRRLRRAFLRGLFAAEGGIGIVTTENYIAYMAYHLSYENEENLANFTQKLLNLEGITSKQIIRKNKGERYIQITNWQNYWKMHKMGVFDLNQRKKKKFLDHVNTMNFYCKMNDKLKKKLLKNVNFRKKGIIHSDRIKKTNYISLKNLFLLASLKKINLNYLKNNIIEARTRNSFIIKDKDFFNFVITKYLPDKLKNSKTWLP